MKKSIIISLITFLILLDFTIKRFVIDTFSNETIYNYGFIGFIKEHNYGISLGMFDNLSMYLLILINVMVIFLIYFGYKKFKFNVYILIILMAGGIGNLLDRILYGYVVDYFYIFISGLKFMTIINLADVMITFGISWFILNELKSLKDESKNIFKSYEVTTDENI